MPAIYTYTLLKIHIILTKYTDPREFSRGRLEQNLNSSQKISPQPQQTSAYHKISASISLASKLAQQSNSLNATMPFKETIKKIKKINLILRINKI